MFYHHSGSGLAISRTRLYDATLGRWTNRDPIQEKGGVNLYVNTAPDPNRQAEVLDAKDGGGLAPGKGIQRAGDPNSDWGSYRARLQKTPGNPTERDNFYLHNSHKGYSHGCVEAPSDRLWKQLILYHDQGNVSLPVRVNYIDPTTLGATNTP